MAIPTNKSNTIFLIVGKSGSGKDTLVNTLCDTLDLKKVISYTTRPSRGKDDEKNHLFATEEDYYRARANKNIVAETQFDGNYYWATVGQIQTSDFYIIDPAGVKKFINTYSVRVPKEYCKNIVIVYIKSNAFERLSRMYAREKENTKSKIKLVWKVFKRFIHDIEVFDGFDEKADYILHNRNGKFMNALSELAGYITLTKQELKNNRG